MLPIVRERLTLVLIALLPFHALFVTVTTKAILGSGHAPMSVLALWKEALLGLILVSAFTEWASEKRKVKSGKWKFDVLDGLILGALAYGLILSFAMDVPRGSILFGFKYDFVPLVAFVMLRRVEWSDMFQKRAMTVLISVGAIVGLYGLLTLVLSDAWFRALGYSDLHSLYVPGGSLAAFQQLGGTATRRMQSVMSGPNQLGVWILIPLGLLLGHSHIAKVKSEKWKVKNVLVPSLLLITLLFTFSRAAWVGFLVMAMAWAAMTLPYKKLKRALAAGALVVIVGLNIGFSLAPSVFLRAVSNRGHIERPLEALRKIQEHPFGLGLGTAGPATNRVSDTCVEMPSEEDALWVADHPELCAFVDGAQVQPKDRECHCPFLPENWYLQWGVEMGVVGLIVSLMLAFLILKKRPMPLAFLGISVAALFLHALEDAAAAYTVWILLSATLHPCQRQSSPARL